MGGGGDRTAGELRHAHAAALAGEPRPELRPLVTASWARASAAGVDPEHHEADVVLEHRDVTALRAEHRLAGVLDLLRGTIGRFVHDSVHVLVVTDEAGRVLWLDGHPAVRRAAERIRFVEGVLWSEAGAGTNAIGTALAVDAPLDLLGAEHFVCAQHAWTCAAAPIHDPDTGRPIGVVDLSGPVAGAHPLTLGLVAAAARLAEGALATEGVVRDERLRQTYLERLPRFGAARTAVVGPSGRVLLATPPAWLGGRLEVPEGGGVVRLRDGTEAVAEPLGRDGFVLRAAPHGGPAVARPRLRLRLLGPEPLAWLRGRPVRLTARHAEVVALLARHSDGLTGERLALELYGEAGNPVTVRAELSRLRGLLGDVLHPRPYRLDAELECDALAVAADLRAGRLRDALARYPGPLLPGSEAPGVVEAREELEGALHRAVLAARDPEALWAWAQTPSGRDDLPAHEELVALLGPADPRRAEALIRRQRLRALYGWAPRAAATPA